MTDILSECIRSVVDLYAAHPSVTLDIPTARKRFAEEADELKAAAEKLTTLSAVMGEITTRSDTLGVMAMKEGARAEVVAEAADVLYTLAGVLAACGITQTEIEAATLAKVAKNDFKRPENGYSAINGKIQLDPVSQA